MDKLDIIANKASTKLSIRESKMSFPRQNVIYNSCIVLIVSILDKTKTRGYITN